MSSSARVLARVLVAASLGFPGLPLETAGCCPASRASRAVAPGGSEGWTELPASPDARTVYVSSSSGNDGNKGLTEAEPKRTVGAAKKLLRDGFPDRLLLRKGDVWDEPLGRWDLSGRSKTERMIVSSYGAEGGRPLLKTGSSNGFEANDGSRHDHLAIVGLHLWADKYAGGKESPRGFQVFGSTHDLLIEDCFVQAYDTNVVIQGTPEGRGRHEDVALHRCVIVDAYTTGNGNSAGLFVSSTDGLFVEECLFDHNGWRDDVAGSAPNWFRHNVYVQNGCTGVVFHGNIVAGSDGIQQRSGGTCEGNLFLKNALALQFGSGTTPEPEGVSGIVRENVVLDGRDLEPGQARGWGLILGNVVDAKIERNVVAHNTTGRAPIPWVLNFDNGHGNPKGLQNVVFEKNVVYDWGSGGRGAQIVCYAKGPFRNVTLKGNQIQELVDSGFLASWSASTPGLAAEIHGSENRWFRSKGGEARAFRLADADMDFAAFHAAIGDKTSTFAAVEYPDPNRTIATYQASIGGPPTLEAFLAEARKQSRSNWRPAYTAGAVGAYVRAGFGL
jgi:hypothetical protein